MMWFWRFSHQSRTDQEATYLQTAGHYATLNRGLSETEMNNFYRQLGIRSESNPSGANMRQRLNHSPVIFTSIDKTSGHAMVASYHFNSKYRIVNPCGVMEIDFGNDSAACSANSVNLNAQGVENELGRFIWFW